MEFIKNNMFWIVGGLVLVVGISAGAYYINSTPDGKTEFIITPRDNQNNLNLDIFDYDFPNYNWLENFPTEFTKIAPPTNSGSSNLSAPAPTQSVETPWEQGPSEPLSVSKPPALPSSDGTPWTDGPSN